MTQITIDQLVKEGTLAGQVTPIGDLTSDYTVAVLAVLSNYANQLSTDVTTSGVGYYALIISNFQDAGIIKKGLSLINDIPSTMNDSSVFTGKLSINSISDVKGNISVQRNILQTSIESNINALKREGIITGTETNSDLSAITGLLAKYTTSDIKDWLNGISPNQTAMDSLASDLKQGSRLVNTKASDTLSIVNGIGGGTTSPPEHATNTIQTPLIDSGIDSFIGSKRLPSSIKPTPSNNGLTAGDIF